MNRIAIITFTLFTFGAMSYGAVNPVSKWNEVAVQATLTAGQGAIPQSRTLAIVQVAVHDALNSIEPRYHRYALRDNICPNASAAAAIATAAHDALADSISIATSAGFGTAAQHAAALLLIDSERDAALAEIPGSYAKNDGIAIGQAAALAIVSRRSSDGATWAARFPYTPGSSPGDWQPTPNPSPSSPAGPAVYILADVVPAGLRDIIASSRHLRAGLSYDASARLLCGSVQSASDPRRLRLCRFFAKSTKQ